MVEEFDSAQEDNLPAGFGGTAVAVVTIDREKVTRAFEFAASATATRSATPATSSSPTR